MPDPYSKHVTFRRYDLNLLPFLRALLATSSVARSSEILGVSQSAVSGALSRLRRTFGDPLFVQVGRSLSPTPKALALQPLVDGLFTALSDLVAGREFLPENEDRCFTICTSDYVTSQLAVPLLKAMRVQAPHASIRFVEITALEQKELELGNIDIQISPKAGETPSDELLSAPLWEDEQVILAPPSMTLPESGLDLATYLAHEHASFFVHGVDSLEKRALSALNLEQRTIIFVPEHHQLPRLVRDIGCLAMLPRSAAQQYAREFELQIHPVPFDVPKSNQSLYWSPVLDPDPAHKWFRELILEAWRSGLRDPEGNDEVKSR